MFAIVDIAGQQFKVEEGQEIFVNRLHAETGSEVRLDNVLLVDNGGNVMVGQPHVKGASIVAEILAEQKGDKVIVFKKKRRKGYQVKNGHRQTYTRIKINSIAV